MQPQEGAYDKEAVEQISQRQIAEPASGRLGLQYPAEVMEQTGGRLASDHWEIVTVQEKMRPNI